MGRSSVLFLVCVLWVGGAGEALGWGGTGHRFINQNAVIHLPPTMAQLSTQQSFLTSHASDADSRKGSDTAEYPKHFIDIDEYPDFQHLTPDLPALINQYGWPRVRGIGILPWATLWTLDSLTRQMKRGDWAKAYQSAADLGHYVGDAHQPLHCTANYDGQLTGNNGIHSRYETGMIGYAAGLLRATPDSVRYVADPYAFIRGYILRSNAAADSILHGDTAAKAASGWSGSGSVPQAYYQAYYTALWQYTGGLTQALMQDATVALASLWYTAWVDAGLSPALAVEMTGGSPSEFQLAQNSPNPFNPSTVLSGSLAAPGRAKLAVYDMLGREVALLMDGMEPAGGFRVRFDASGLASGVYLYRLSSPAGTITRRMAIIR